MRYLGIDIGTKRIGIALSDEMGWTAQPHSVLKHTKIENDLDEIGKIIEENEVEHIVLGLPMNMSGTESEMSTLARKYADELKKRFDFPVELWDERLSSAAAERVLLEGNMRRNKRKQVIDKVAAAYILQGFLDSKAK